MTSDSKELGKKIAALRKKQGLSQIGLAKLGGLPVIAIRRCEQNGEIPLHRYVALAKLLGAEVTVSDPPGLHPPTLAHKLGTVAHISPLLRKLANHGLASPEEMGATAVARGCGHYANMPAWQKIKPIAAREISNEELAVGLLSPCHPYNPLFIRVGGQLLSAPESNPETLARLAIMERCAPTVKYIAACGQETEPDNPFWKAILENLTKPGHSFPEFPKTSIHISRFRVETGITNPFKPGAPKIVWLRPQTTP